MGKSLIVIFAFAIVVSASAVFVISKNTQKLVEPINKNKVIHIAATQESPTPTINIVIPNTPFPTRAPTNTPTPTIISKLQFQASSFDSPDGTKNLMLKKKIEEKSESYESTVSDKVTGMSTEVFSGLKAASQGFLIPYNSWSPDNLYFFLKDVSSGFDSKYLVFNASEKNFSDNSKYLDIKKYFDENLSEGLYLEDVTGWAAPYLLIVNTREKNGAAGPSFWFDITSNSFTLLSTRFH